MKVRVLGLVWFTVVLSTLVASGAGAARSVEQHDFQMSVNFTGLYPAADLTMPVTVTNPQSYDLAVETATVLVGDASPECGASNVSAQTFSGAVVVHAGRSASIPIRMQMLASAPDACQGAVFPLAFRAHGEIVGAGPRPSTGGFAFTGNGSRAALLAEVGAAATIGGLALLMHRRLRTGTR